MKCTHSVSGWGSFCSDTAHIRVIETTLCGLASGVLKIIAKTESNLAKIPYFCMHAVTCLV